MFQRLTFKIFIDSTERTEMLKCCDLHAKYEFYVLDGIYSLVQVLVYFLLICTK